MKPLIVLLICFGISSTVTYALHNEADVMLSGKIALAGMLMFTAFGHFKYTAGMQMMLPPQVPGRRIIVLATGALEMVLAVLIFIASRAVFAGWLLVAMFILFLPANIYAAAHNINYQTAAHDGKGLPYLWFRVPFQLLLLWWTWFFVIHPHQSFNH